MGTLIAVPRQQRRLESMRTRGDLRATVAVLQPSDCGLRSAELLVYTSHNSVSSFHPHASHIASVGDSAR